MSKNNWAVRRWRGEWGVYWCETLYESHPTLHEAHTAATQLAVIQECSTPGGLDKLKRMKDCYETWGWLNRDRWWMAEP